MKVTKIDHWEKINQLFTRLRMESRKVILRYNELEFKGQVSSFNSNNLHLVVLGNVIPNCDHFNLQFMISGEYYFTEVDTKKIENKTIVVSMPLELEIRSIRRYPRAYVEGNVKARFKLLTNESTASTVPANSTGVPPKLAGIYFEMQKNVPDIKKVLAMVGKELNSIGPISEIKLHKENEKYDEEINLVIRYNKPFLVSNSSNPKSYVSEFPANDMINYAAFLKELRRSGWDNNRLREAIIERQTKLTSLGIRSIMVIPIRLFDNVIGHIQIKTTQDTAKELRVSDAYYVMALADIVSEALAKGKLFNLNTGKDYDIPVINISAGGVYLEVNSPYINKFLHEEMKLQLDIIIIKKEIQTTAEIRRIDYIDKTVRLAIKFTRVDEETQKYIEEFVNHQLEYVKSMQIQKIKQSK